MTASKFISGAQFPQMTLQQVGGGSLELGTPQGGHDWRLVVTYRGKHCPLCTKYLKKLEGLKQDFYDLGVDIVAVSGDSEQQAKAHKETMSLSFPVAYGLSIEQMQILGLYISHQRSLNETDHPFAELGIFVVNDQGQVQIIDISNAPFARSDLETLVNGLKFIRNPENNYPIRGTYI
jgi:peroxiredoxin